jgi:hypothetical protein
MDIINCLLEDGVRVINKLLALAKSPDLDIANKARTTLETMKYIAEYAIEDIYENELTGDYVE